MASSKKRRKASKSARQTQPPTGAFRHRDGDRRRRGGPSADQAIKDKEARRQFGTPPLEEEDHGDAT